MRFLFSPSWWLSLFRREELGTIWYGENALRNAKSLPSGDGKRLRLCFRNMSDQTLLLCWMDSEGKPFHFYSLLPAVTTRLIRHNRPAEKDHIETSQIGHSFLVVASPDPDATRRAKTLEGTIPVVAYRPEHINPATDCFFRDKVSDTTPMQLILIYKRSKEWVTCPSPCITTQPQGDWFVRVYSTHFDPTPIDSTKKCYIRCTFPDTPDWTIFTEDCWDGNLPRLRETFCHDLYRAIQCLPTHAREHLCHTTPFWLNRTLRYGPAVCPIQGRGMCFHPGEDWLKRNGMHTNKKHGIELYESAEYMKSREHWQPGGLLLHELCHAYHCLCIPSGYDNKDIRSCWEAAMKEKLYDCVAVHGPQGPTAKAYACQDPMEYFAELSTAFLGSTDEDVEFNKWFPFNRKQLKRHDPRAYELLCRLWKVHDGDTHETQPSDAATTLTEEDTTT